MSFRTYFFVSLDLHYPFYWKLAKFLIMLFNFSSVQWFHPTFESALHCADGMVQIHLSGEPRAPLFLLPQQRCIRGHGFRECVLDTAQL